MNVKTEQDRLADLEKRIAKIERALGDATTPPTVKNKKLSAKEFLLSKTVSSEAQKALALAFFLERMEGLTSFNVADLEDVFRSAREKVPANMNDVVNKNVGKGFIMEAKEKKDFKKAWHLTSTGEQHVENEMN